MVHAMKYSPKIVVACSYIACLPLLQINAEAISAFEIYDSGSISFQTSPFNDPGEPEICGIPGGASYWLSYILSDQGTLSLNTDGSNFDTLLGVFIDNGANQGYSSLIQIACDDDGGTNGLTSALQIQVTQGVAYYIMVDGKNGAYGQVLFHYQFDEAPTISSIDTQHIDEEQSTPAISFAVSDKETPADDLQVLGSSSDQTLVPDAAIVFGGSGTNRTVTITPTPYFFGTNTITLVVVDQIGNCRTNSFTLEVEKINHPPVVTLASYTRIPSNSISISISALLRNATDRDGDTLTVTGVSPRSRYGNAPVTKGLSFVSYTPSASFNSPDTFTYTVSDGNGGITTGIVNILVSASNGQLIVY